MFCTNCGHQLAENENRCPACGTGVGGNVVNLSKQDGKETMQDNASGLQQDMHQTQQNMDGQPGMGGQPGNRNEAPYVPQKTTGYGKGCLISAIVLAIPALLILVIAFIVVICILFLFTMVFGSVPVWIY